VLIGSLEFQSIKQEQTSNRMRWQRCLLLPGFNVSRVALVVDDDPAVLEVMADMLEAVFPRRFASRDERGDWALLMS
jgi:hypothetical protein